MSINTCDRLSLVRLIGLGAFALALALVGWSTADTASAQDGESSGLVAPGTWQAHPSLRRVQALSYGDGAMWAGSDGGIFRYDLGSGEVTRFTSANGLASPDVRTLAFDVDRNVLWIGYADGVLQRLSPANGEFFTHFDIARAERYPQRGINSVRPLGDSLLVATDFGIVVFDVAQGEVRDTYDRFGALDRGQPAYDIIEAPRPDGDAGFWVGTRDGVAYADRHSPTLRAPSSWTVDAHAPAPALALAYFGGHMYLGKAETPGEPIAVGDMWRRAADGTWTRQHASGQSVSELLVAGGRMHVVSSFFVSAVEPTGQVTPVLVSENGVLLSGAVGPDGNLWVGSRIYGLNRLPFITPGMSGPVASELEIIPTGPLSNDVMALDVGSDGTVWVGFRPAFGVINGMGRFDGASWQNFASTDGYDVALGRITTVKVDSRGYAWGGSEGDGLTRVSPDGEVVTFRADNSTLRPEPGFNVIMVFGVDEDSQGNVWVTNRRAANALHRWNPEDGWTAVPRPPGTPPAAEFTDLYIDRFDQKWVTLFRSGFLVARTDPNDPTSAEAVAVTGAGSPTTGTGLPSTRVQAFVEDLDGRVWIGTERGLATVFSPGSVIANPALAQPTWARTPDQASYFLRDLNITAMAVDPAGRKWLASTSGAWLINAEGNEVEAHFTPENSPLPSSVVVDVAVESATGKVWFATDGGVMSYQGVSIDPVARAERLRVYPNPYNPVEDPFVRVEGLVAETRVRILTADGQVVAAFDARGGAATWDGRDQRTGQPVPSGVYIIAAAGAGGEGTAYGKIAVIR